MPSTTAPAGQASFSNAFPYTSTESTSRGLTSLFRRKAGTPSGSASATATTLSTGDGPDDDPERRALIAQIVGKTGSITGHASLNGSKAPFVKAKVTDIMSQTDMSLLFVAKVKRDGAIIWSQERVVAKILNCKKLKGDTATYLQIARREPELWSRVSHPNILKFYGILVVEDNMLLMSPLMSHGDLDNYLRKYELLRGVSYSERMKLMKQTVSALDYLHTQSIVHGDIKPPNVLISEAGEAMIADFGLAREDVIPDSLDLDGTCNATTPTLRSMGSMRYLAPEILRYCSGFNDPDEIEPGKASSSTPTALRISPKSKSKASDVWAAACLLYFTLTNNEPWREYSKYTDLVDAFAENVLPPRPRVPSRPSSTDVARGINDNSVWELMLECWNQDPRARPTMQHVLARVGSVVA